MHTHRLRVLGGPGGQRPEEVSLVWQTQAAEGGAPAGGLSHGGALGGCPVTFLFYLKHFHDLPHPLVKTLHDLPLLPPAPCAVLTSCNLARATAPVSPASALDTRRTSMSSFPGPLLVGPTGCSQTSFPFRPFPGPQRGGPPQVYLYAFTVTNCHHLRPCLPAFPHPTPAHVTP